MPQWTGSWFFRGFVITVGLFLLFAVPSLFKYESAGDSPFAQHTPTSMNRHEAARTPSSADNYCVAVRGNGDAMPAHWGALARAFEAYGAPLGMAGGSSGSITTFFWESAIQNPLLSQDGFERGRQLALLFKALEGVTYYLYEQPRWSALAAWMRQMQKSETFNPLVALSDKKSLALHLPAAISAIQDLRASGIFFGRSIQAVGELVIDPGLLNSPKKQALLSTRLSALKSALVFLGKFDAKNDVQLFIRNGIIDFGALALRFGAMGDFLALREAPEGTRTAMKTLFETCLSASVGKSWVELIQAEPRCKDQLNLAVSSFFEKYEFKKSSRIYENVGAFGKALATTSVVTDDSSDNDDSVDRFRALRKKYLEKLAPDVGGDLVLRDQDLRFGYWGNPEDLEKAASQLSDPANPFSELDKSKRFVSLGSATWWQALSLSPAEPGLSPALEFGSVGLSDERVSFGGWSDLHPMPILKAIGCERVVYVTRRGGDSMFSIGVSKRLLGYAKPGWELLDSKDKTSRSQVLNNNGSAEFQDSPWFQMYNLRNPQSSYAKSIAAADAVVCTDWNAYDVKTHFPQLVATSYHAPIFENRGPKRSPFASGPWISRTENTLDPDKGFTPYAGCIPLQ